MRWWVPAGLAVVALGLFLFSQPDPEAEPELSRGSAPVAKRIAAARLAVAPAAAVAPAVAVGGDAGSSQDAGGELEVTVEVFDERGHAAGQTLELKSPPCADGRSGVTRWAKTNVMGFARVSLPAGVWEIENFQSAPTKLEVAEAQAAFVVRKLEPDAGLIEGSVVDDQSSGVPFAEVTRRDRPPADGRGTWRSNHMPPEGELTVRADAHGRFALRSFEPSVILIAEHDGRRSLPVVATTGTNTTQLRLFTAAYARFSARCPGLFVRYEYAGEGIELQLPSGAEVKVAAGPQKFLARCLLKHKLLKGSVELLLAPGEHARVNFELVPMEGLHVRVVDAHGVALPGVTLSAQTSVLEDEPPEVSQASRAGATTDAMGTAVLVPDFLGSFDPLFRLELGGAWRTQKDVLIRLGDQPIEVVAVPSAGR